MNPGDVIGPYRVLATLGEGGMGVVYRARDGRLNRDVALKILPGALAGDADRLARFRREAQVLASLNHPNIAHLYGIEDTPASASSLVPASHALVMELVEGPTLAGRIASGPLPVAEALAIARQIAQAIDAAHGQGIIHRDLKPANIKVRDDGTVKVLDFGLAKAMLGDGRSSEEDAAAVTAMNSPTLTAPGTALGMILGTAAYMAPEQASGRVVDRRADIWAFGVVLFEMLTGRRAFEGDNVSEVLASVLKSDPDWSAIPTDVPPPVRRLLRRCLEKDPRRRLRDLAEGMLQLDEGMAADAAMSSAATAPGVGVVPRVSWWRRAWPLVVTAATTAGVIGGIGVWRTPVAAPRVPIRFQFEPPAATPFYLSPSQTDLAISRDGQTLIYCATTGSAGRSELWIRRFDQVEGVPVRGGETATAPIPSPSGDWVAFVDQSLQVELDKVSVLGGPRAPVARTKARILGGTWTHDDKIVLGASESPLLIVAAAGGDPAPLTTLGPGEVEHTWPSEVPGTSVVLFTVNTSLFGGTAGAQLAAIDRGSGRTVKLGIAGFHPRYLSPGFIVYAMSSGSLRAIAFNPRTLAVAGSPVPVLEGVTTKVTGAADFDVSSDGHLVFVKGTDVPTRLLTWMDRAGHETPIAAPPRNYYYARLSPDGTRVSLDIRAEEENVWIWDLKRENMTRLTDRTGSFQYGLWTPDSKRVVFSSLGLPDNTLMSMHADSTGAPMPIGNFAKSGIVPYPNAITPDGATVVFRGSRPSGDPNNNDLFTVSLGGGDAPKTLLATEHNELNATLSPDGKWMAFESNLSGPVEVYVRPFPNVEDGQWKLSTGGGTKPLWSPGGREIFYLSDGKMVAVPVDTMRGFVAGKPEVLFDVTGYYRGGIGRNYDVTSDGRRFIMIKDPPRDGGRSLPISVVLNWADEVRSRVH